MCVWQYHIFKKCCPWNLKETRKRPHFFFWRKCCGMGRERRVTVDVLPRWSPAEPHWMGKENAVWRPLSCEQRATEQWAQGPFPKILCHCGTAASPAPKHSHHLKFVCTSGRAPSPCVFPWCTSLAYGWAWLDMLVVRGEWPRLSVRACTT